MQFQSYPYPLISNVPSKGGAVAGWIILAALGASVVLGVVTIGFKRSVQGAGYIPVYLAGTAIILLSILFLVRRLRLSARLPFKPGRYLFPMDLIDAQERMLRVVPMSSLIDFRGVHQHTNGAYTNTTLTFTFEGGAREVFTIFGKAQADEVLRQLGEAQRGIRAAAEAQDLDALNRMDPLFEVRMKDLWNMQPPSDDDVEMPAARHLGGLFSTGAILGVSGIAAAILAVPMWHFRNNASDEAIFAQAKALDSSSEYEFYLWNGKRHADEVRTELLPRAALREAKDKKTVSALRAFMRKFPGSVVDQEAHEAEHALFQKTLTDFRAQASTDDERLLPFMEKLLGYLEKNDTSRVEARFESPTNEDLKHVDELLAKLGNDPGDSKRMVPVAPYFAEKVGVARETVIVDGLHKGFAAVFPADVMQIKQGPRIGPDGKPLANQPDKASSAAERLERLEGISAKDPDYLNKLNDALGTDSADESAGEKSGVVPATLDIKYNVSWAGDFFTEEKGDRKFVGIVVDFHVAMKIPGDQDTFEFDLRVEPPDRFTVDYSNPMYSIGGGPSEGQVYNVMAARAFDELSIKMRRVFFRPGSEAYGVPQANIKAPPSLLDPAMGDDDGDGDGDEAPAPKAPPPGKPKPTGARVPSHP